jgi:hypothetical protein
MRCGQSNKNGTPARGNLPRNTHTTAAAHGANNTSQIALPNPIAFARSILRDNSDLTQNPRPG